MTAAPKSTQSPELASGPSQSQDESPTSFAQFLQVEKARERQRNAKAHELPLQME